MTSSASGLDVTPAVPVAPLAPMVGRARELGRLTGLVTSGLGRLVTISGPSGIGKTRLALEAAVLIQRTMPIRALLVDLGPVRDQAGLMSAIARAVGLPGADLSPAGLARLLGDGPALLVLDGAQNLSAEGTALAALLRASPGTHALVTATCPLRTHGERVLRLGPLDVPDSGWEPGLIRCSPAVELFIECASRADVGFRAMADSLPTIAAICRCVEGLPLALELAAARIPVLGLPVLLERLSMDAAALDTLANGPAGTPERHRSMRAAIGWCYGLLTEPQQRLVRLMSLTAEDVLSYERAAEMAVAAGSVRMLDDLSGLLDARFVQPAGCWGQAAAAPCFTVPRLIRLFARERAGPPAEAGPGPSRPAREPGTRLTPRERQVLALLADGKTNKEIGRQLSLSAKTVMHYTVAIYAKIGVPSRSAATAWAIRSGLCDGGLPGLLAIRRLCRPFGRWAFARVLLRQLAI